MSRRSKTPAAAAAPAALPLPPELTIYTVRELQPQWLAWLGQVEAAPDDAAAVQAADVGEVDAAGLQMLLALQRALAERGRRLHIQTPSAALQAGFEAAGLADWLQAQGRVEQAA